jgi:hypothetical protein
MDGEISGGEVHCTDCHTDAEDDPGEGFLGLALAVGEHQSSDDDGDQRQPGRNRAGKGGFEDGDCVVPRIAGALGVDRQRREEHQGWNGQLAGVGSPQPEAGQLA